MNQDPEPENRPVELRAFLVKALIDILALAGMDPPFGRITVEPIGAIERFNYLWLDGAGSHAVEIRCTRSLFSKPQIEAIAAQLEETHPNAGCTLSLIGTVHPRLEKTTMVGKTVLKKRPFDLPTLLDEAGESVATFRASAGLPSRSPAENLIVAQALVTQLGVFCANSLTYDGADFRNLLRQGILEATAP